MSTQISIRTTPELVDQFAAIAEATGRTRTYLINQAMEEFIAREAWQIAEIQKALEEADAGDFATEEEMTDLDAKWSQHAR